MSSFELTMHTCEPLSESRPAHHRHISTVDQLGRLAARPDMPQIPWPSCLGGPKQEALKPRPQALSFSSRLQMLDSAVERAAASSWTARE